jgi:uncharacterized protein (UPF0548 family)
MIENKGEKTVEISMMSRCALACMRLELGLVPPAKVAEARRYVDTAGEEFDGPRLIELCMEGRAADGDAALEKALRKLHSSLAIESVGRRPRKKTSLLVRLSATLLGRGIVFVMTIVFVVLLLALAQYILPELDIYALRDQGISQVKGILGK